MTDEGRLKGRGDPHPTPHNHRYWLEKGGHWEYFWLSTTGQEAVAVQRDIQAAAGPVFQMKEQTVVKIASCCLRLIEDRAETPGLTSAIAYEALMALYDDVLFLSRETGPNGDDRMSRVIRHIRAHVDHPLDIASLAGLARLSRTHCTRVFTANQGLPPAEFIVRERMTQAARLLRQHEMKVADIAKACGFHDPNYFTKAFRRNFGISPTDFRTTGMYAVSRDLDRR